MNGVIFLENLNDIMVVVIPKVSIPKMMNKFKPISLCKVIYKVISKAIENRLKQVLGSLISDQQSAFVLGHLILDNIISAFEIQHFMKRKRQGRVGRGR